MTWVNLSSAFSYGSGLTSSQMQHLRDNITALANGDSGAPSIQTAAIASGAVTHAKIASNAVETHNILDEAVTNDKIAAGTFDKDRLKTSTGSATGWAYEGQTHNLELQDYCFFPNITSPGTYGLVIYAYHDDPTDTVARLRLVASSMTTYGVYWRYCTASDKPFIYSIKNKDGDIVATWACDDPPPRYWGLQEKPDGFIPPVVITGNDNKIIQPESEIVAFNVAQEFLKHLRDKSAKDKTSLTFELNAFDYTDKVFRSKNISEV